MAIATTASPSWDCRAAVLFARLISVDWFFDNLIALTKRCGL
jgi:hypothetical protein